MSSTRPRRPLNLYSLNDRKRVHEDQSDELMMNLSSDIDEGDLEYSRDLDSPSDYTFDSDHYRPMPVARGSEKYWNSKGAEKRCSRRCQVACGLGAKARLRFGSLSTITPVDHSSSFETNEDDDDISDLYTPMNKENRSPPRLLRGLSMIEELSPIADISDNELPKVPSLKLSRNWRPLQTSTTTSVHHIALPKTNPHHIKATSSTPRHSLPSRGSVLSYGNNVYDPFDHRPLSFFDDTPSSEWTGKTESTVGVYAANWKPDQFGLPAPYARRIGCKGKIHLTMSLSGSFLTINVVNAVLFLDPYQAQASSYVRVELKRNPKYSRHLRSRSEDRYSRSDCEQSFRTRLVPMNNRPQYYENFTFELHRRNYHDHDMISVSMWVTNMDSTSRKRKLGCMAFPIRRLIKKANMMSEGGFDENLQSLERTVVNDGDFFLLKPELGEKQNFPESKINVQKYYDDIGTNNSSGLTRSPPKIMRESNWSKHLPVGTTPSTSSHHPTFTVGNCPLTGYSVPSSFTAGNYGVECSSSSGGTGNLFAPLNSMSNSNLMLATVRHNDLDYTTESSSINSTEPYHKFHFALPSITTTSDGTSELSSVDGLQSNNVDYKFLYAHDANAGHQATSKGKSHPVLMRRASSFTYSPKDTAEKHNKRAEPEEPKKKFSFSRFTKTLSYIRNKMEMASTSTLYPTKEEVRQWERSFESLLNHRYGCLLFRAFLKGEFSDENVDFWLECEEFKKMKEGKKATIQRAHAIFDEYIAEQSPKEVNLDSDTRAATKAALESGAKPNMFTLAQIRIEQLMAKDSYRRFLKSKMFLDLLNDGSNSISSEATIKANPSA